jgi:YgiT-type zinc finger domain-containing protein
MTEETPQAAPPQAPCPRCGEMMRTAMVKTAVWQDDRVFIVEDIPAQVCDACMEQFYDEDTTDALRRLMEEGFPSIEPRREILVPIFSLEGRILVRSAVSDEEMPVDY